MTWILLAVGVLLTAGTAVFVASEFSLVALDRHTVEKAQQGGDRRAAGVLSALTHLSTNLSGAQLGITITTLLFGFAVQDPLAGLLSPVAAALGIPGSAVGPVSVVAAMAIAYAFSMLFGELVPKNLAIAAPMATAKVVAPLQHFFTTVFRPLIAVFNSTANAILRLVGIEPQEELSAARSPAELDYLVRHSARAGSLDRGTAVLLSRTLALADREAADVMTHRGAMIAVDASASAAEVLELSRTSGHSRFPVIDGSEDDVVGVVQVRQAVTVPRAERAGTPVRSIMADVHRLPETVPLDNLLLDLRDLGAQLAVVVDEYGGTSGIVTLEDVIEEIVGEVNDEHDEDEPERYARESERGWVVSGLMRPDEIRRELGVIVPESTDYDTLGGLLMDELRRIPAPGDVVESAGLRLEVLAMDGRRVDSVRLMVLDDSVRVAPVEEADDE
ncbi:hemolysin family protein [Brachybacterium phenoliresistens]|uniref:Membrane protein n=1 Tax=Brachybacterium phenoliresistens TaxID=396014 RepID=Z9JXV2_9MICO|nr:hemolysin family protein [Brachybacterium phenoliresistens]EWS82989.1 membrane protein [Brachybacterium phenoliresistens]